MRFSTLIFALVMCVAGRCEDAVPPYNPQLGVILVGGRVEREEIGPKGNSRTFTIKINYVYNGPAKLAGQIFLATAYAYGNRLSLGYFPDAGTGVGADSLWAVRIDANGDINHDENAMMNTAPFRVPAFSTDKQRYDSVLAWAKIVRKLAAIPHEQIAQAMLDTIQSSRDPGCAIWTVYHLSKIGAFDDLRELIDNKHVILAGKLAADYCLSTGSAIGHADNLWSSSTERYHQLELWAAQIQDAYSQDLFMAICCDACLRKSYPVEEMRKLVSVAEKNLQFSPERIRAMRFHVGDK